jgi:hypothetical protein
MGHRHFCEFAGHYWDCDGMAKSLLAPEASVCMCLYHGVSMEEGDHSECAVELLSCPDHRDEQMRAMGYEPGYTLEPPAPDADESCMFKDQDGNRIVGFCLWCDKNFYTMDEVEAHNADEMTDCPMFQELKDKDCGPPVLEQLFQQAGLLDGESEGKERDRHGREEER